jgi:acyl-CoA thioester hydrolase
MKFLAVYFKFSKSLAMQPVFFTYVHLVQFYETDQMGIVHHSNYLRFCEEARVAWAKSHGLIDFQKADSAAKFAVLSTKVVHLAPLFFGDSVQIFLQAKRVGARLVIQYLMKRNDKVIAEIETCHVSMSKDLKPMRLPLEIDHILEKQQWIETLLSSL